MPVSVVDGLEVIEVDHQERNDPAIAARARELDIELIAKLGVVPESGQAVGQCGIAKPFLQAADAQAVADAGRELEQIERLGQIVIRSGQQSAVFEVAAVERRDHDDVGSVE